MKRFLCVATILLTFSSASFAQIDFEDNFDDGNIDGWMHLDLVEFFTGAAPRSSLSFPDGGIRILSPTTGPALPPGGGAIFQPDLIFTDFEMSVDVVEDLGSESGSLYGIAARSQAPFFTYILIAAKAEPSFFPDAVGKTVFSMGRLDGAEQEELGMTFVDVPDDAKLKLVFRGEGASLTGELFSLSDLSTPLATLTAEDSTYASGYAEILAADAIPGDGTRFLDAFADVTFDNFSLVATQVPEPAGGFLAIVGVLLASAKRRRRS